MANFPPVVVQLGFVADIEDPGSSGGVASVGVPPVVVKLGLIPDLSDTAPPTVTGVDMPPIRMSLTVPAFTVSSSALVLVSPGDGATVPTATPTFTVSVALDYEFDDDIFTVEIQLDDENTFSSPVTIRTDMLGSDGGVDVVAAAAVPSPGWWRARLLIGTDEVIGWTSPSSYTVAATPVASSLPVLWTVSPTADRPVHLWHFDPAGPDTGDTVTIYGQGFPAAGHLYFNDTVLPYESWRKVAATGDNTGGSRRIDGVIVTPEHYEVVFIAPAYKGPGAPLTVES